MPYDTVFFEGEAGDRERRAGEASDAGEDEVGEGRSVRDEVRHGPEDGEQVPQRGEAALRDEGTAGVAYEGRPFAEDWPDLRVRLLDAPELEAKTLFEFLMAQHPDRYEPGQLRTLQRRVLEWRGKEGPEREVFFAQEHRPGEAMQTDFTHCEELEVTIAGEPFPHLLCHPVLPYSNWEWATVCHSESLMALRRGVQAAVFKLGRVTEFHQTDNSTAATHDLASGMRGFNVEYQR